MIRNMVMGNVGFIGIGEGGCNIVNIFEKLGYKKVYYINSASKDLDNLDTFDATNTVFHIDNEFGCARNRNKAKQLAKENYDLILSNIQKKMSNLKIIFVVFSMGGGTGSGMSPILLNGLTKRFPNTIFNTVSIIPDLLSSAKMKYNACECYLDIKKIKNKLGNSYFINNNNICKNGKYSVKLETIDNAFVSRLHEIINASDKNGSVDDSEVLTLLSTNGNVIVSEILPENSDAGRLLLDLPFSDIGSKSCVFNLYSVNNDDDFIKDIVEDQYGIPEDDFLVYSENSSFVATFGIPFPDLIFDKLREYSEAMMTLRSEISEESNIDLDISSLSGMFSSNKTNKLPEKVKEKAIKNSQDILSDLEDF